jgi:hypothetical protein
LGEYRRAWRDPAMIHGSCSDYRAAATVDLEHDTADIARKVECPALVFYGSRGQMAKLFDIPAEWRKRLAKITEASLPGGHFFVDQFPRETAEILLDFLAGRRVDSKEAFYRAKDLLMKKARKVPAPSPARPKSEPIGNARTRLQISTGAGPSAFGCPTFSRARPDLAQAPGEPFGGNQDRRP